MGSVGAVLVSDDWADGIVSPEDRKEIEATAEAIVKDDGMWLELTLYTSVEGARDFLETYDKASEGDIMSMFAMLTFLGKIAEVLGGGIDMPPTPADD
jgi:hypothetical protein